MQENSKAFESAKREFGRFGGGFVIVCFFFLLVDDDEEDDDRCDFLSFLAAQTLVGFVELAFDTIFSDDFITLHKTFLLFSF